MEFAAADHVDDVRCCEHGMFGGALAKAEYISAITSTFRYAYPTHVPCNVQIRNTERCKKVKKFAAQQGVSSRTLEASTHT